MSTTEAQEVFEIGLQVQGRLVADSMDDAAARILRELEPKLEAFLGLQGIALVSFSHEYAMRPLP